MGVSGLGAEVMVQGVVPVHEFGVAGGAAWESRHPGRYWAECGAVVACIL